MKNFLSLLLSTLLLISPINSVCFAESSWKSKKSATSSSSVNRQRVVIHGDSMPTLVINNNSNSEANAKSSASAKAVAGTGKGVELLKFILKVLAIYFTIKYARSIIGNVQKSFGQLLEAIKSIGHQSNPEAQSDVNEALQQNSGDSIEKSRWNAVKNLFHSFYVNWLSELPLVVTGISN